MKKTQDFHPDIVAKDILTGLGLGFLLKEMENPKEVNPEDMRVFNNVITEIRENLKDSYRVFRRKWTYTHPLKSKQIIRILKKYKY